MKCGQKCEVYSSVVGYHRPIQNWNVGKREEFKDRVAYNEQKSMNSQISLKEVGVSSGSSISALKSC